ncbi:mercury transporter MerT [Nitratireductor sp. CAU 1489]|uniref:Mercuric transport protein MerT n=1 Tax=Nitratireductor arenosus TaxID=2682096 RepID=A0A844QIM3_9HYPH|nr:mercuric transporter MerT family protein [Nitratireductor arenosus]MVA97781.1 mercury transporter MerT [Nitratireductor arenosus]
MTDNSLQRDVRTDEAAAPGPGVGLAIGAGLFGALAASACCMIPLGLFLIGVSGAWIGNLTALAPFQPFILAATGVCLGYGFWRLRSARGRDCAKGSACARPLSRRLVNWTAGLATILVVAALAFDMVAPALLGS